MKINKVILSFLMALSSVTMCSTDIQTYTQNENPAIKHARRFEVLYAQHTLRKPITSDNPTKDIILLKKHIEFLETEKNELTSFKSKLGTFICKANGALLALENSYFVIRSILGTYNPDLLIKMDTLIGGDNTYVDFDGAVGQIIMSAIVLTTISFKLASKLEQEKTTKLEAIEKNINLDQIIIKQLNKKQIQK